MTEGRKDDGGKDRWDLAPWDAFSEIIKVLTFGAKKYDGWNWAAGLKYSRVRAALQRHLLAFDRGIRDDGETGLHHLAHAGCCLVFLLTYELFKERYKEFDDRFIFKLTDGKSWPQRSEEKTITRYYPRKENT